MRHFLTIIMTISIFGAYAGDIITLSNNKKFDGEVTKIKNCVVTFKATDNKKYHIPADSIISIEFENVESKIYTEYMADSNDNADKCLKGRMDADAFHGKAGKHIILGVLFGPFTLIGAAIANPNPLDGKETPVMSKNSDLFQDPAYLSCYKKKAKGKNIGNAAAGWSIWLLFLIIAAA